MSRLGIIRSVAIALGLLFLLAAAVAQWQQAPRGLALYLSIAGVLVAGSAFSIREPRRRAEDADRGYWEMTGERFRDPASGHMMEVRHNPVTGEKDYVDVEND